MRKLLLAPTLLFAGCGETPPPMPEGDIVLAAGSYRIEMSGVVSLAATTAGPDSKPPITDICLTEVDLDRWPHAAMRAAIASQSSALDCRSYDEERQGNSFSGRVSCTINNKDGTTTMQFPYSGQITPSGFAGKAGIRIEAMRYGGSMGKMDSEEIGLGKVDSPFAFTRTGDCAD